MPKIFNKAMGYNQDSKFELEMTNTVLQGLEYHPLTISWISPAEKHKYTPDWVIHTEKHKSAVCTEKCKRIYIEGKGFLRGTEKKKYVQIKDCLKPHEELVFLFQNPNKPISKAVKKDGTKTTHAQWATKNGFRFFDKNTIKELLK